MGARAERPFRNPGPPRLLLHREAPAAPSCEGTLWIPPGQPVTIGPYEIPDGMVYVVDPAWGRGSRSEISAIDPRLPIDRERLPPPPGPHNHFAYRSGYRHLSPGGRAAYLEWLAAGRPADRASSVHTQLLLFGLERRLMLEAPDPPEAEALVAELERLLGQRAQFSLLGSYGVPLLEWSRWVYDLPLEIPPDRELDDWQFLGTLPFRLQVALGRVVRSKEPLPTRLAWAWVRTGPFPLRKAAHRCPEEFRQLFEVRYREAYPEGGLRLRPGKTKLRAHYWMVNPSARQTRFLAHEDLPDVTTLKAPVRKLQALVDQVTEELSPYSRWVGRTGETTGPMALGLLPAPLERRRKTGRSRQLAAWLEARLRGTDVLPIPSRELLDRWPTGTPGRITGFETRALGGFCRRWGVGFEPDLGRGGPALHRTGTVVLFRLAAPSSEGPGDEPSENYRLAALLLRPLAKVLLAGGEVGDDAARRAVRSLAARRALSPREERRLEAHLAWLLAEPPGFAGVRKAVEPLDPSERRALGQLLIAAAGGEGSITAAQLEVLQKSYRLLGLDREAVFFDVHGLMSGDGGALAAVGASPPSDQTGAAHHREGPETFQLDPDRVQRKRRESLEVSGMLDEIFAEEPEPAVTSRPAPAEGATALLPGLDGPHSRLLERLALGESWARPEIERLCGELDLLLDGALETLNEAAYDLCGDPLLEGDEVVELDPEVLAELRART